MSENALRAAVEGYIAWQYRMRGARRFTLTDLRAALDSPQPETLDVETVARAYRDAAERSSTTHDLLAQMTVNLNAALGGAS